MGMLPQVQGSDDDNKNNDDDKKQWHEFIKAYKNGKIDISARPDHISNLDRHLEELGGWLSAPARPDDEDCSRSLMRYSEDVLQNYKEAGSDLKLEAYTRLAATLCNAPMAILNLIDSKMAWAASEYSLTDWRQGTVSRSHSFCAHTILRQSKEVFVVADAPHDWRFSRLPIVCGEPHIRYYMGAPLTTSDGRVLGALCVLDTSSDRPDTTDAQKMCLMDLADTIMRELDLRAEYARPCFVRHSNTDVYSRLMARKAKKVFLSSISHELRSPLHGLLASTELMVDDGHLTPFQDLCAKTIGNCGRTLCDVIEQVLSLSDNDEVEVKKEKVNLSNFVEEVVDATWAGKSKLKDCAKGKFEVLVDMDVTQMRHSFLINRGEIGRIIMNLFGNAIKYTDQGFLGVSLSAKAPAFYRNGKRLQHVSLVFEDSGKGIQSDFIPKLFIPFAQQDQLCEGFGLGLSLVKQLVDKNEGTIDVASEVDKGTKITVTLLLETIKEQPQDQPEESLGVDSLRGTQFSLFEPTENPRLSESLAKTCQESFGMIQTELERAEVVLLIDGNAMQSLRAKDLDVPIVVFEHGSQPNPRHTDFLQTPVGPSKLGRALHLAIDHHRQKLYQARRSSIIHLDPVSPPTSCAIKEQDPMHNSAMFSSPEPAKFDLPSLDHVSHNGSIGSSIGISDTTSFSFGRGDDQSDPLGTLSKQTSMNESVTEDSHKQICCLCVDDNPINLQILSALLKKLDISFVTAENGKVAFDRYKERGGFDLVFMDVKMPVMDGIESAKLIRRHELENRLPKSLIVALTGAGAKEEGQCKSSGVDHFCKKPVSIKNLTSYLHLVDAGHATHQKTMTM